MVSPRSARHVRKEKLFRVMAVYVVTDPPDALRLVGGDLPLFFCHAGMREMQQQTVEKEKDQSYAPEGRLPGMVKIGPCYVKKGLRQQSCPGSCGRLEKFRVFYLRKSGCKKCGGNLQGQDESS